MPLPTPVHLGGQQVVPHALGSLPPTREAQVELPALGFGVAQVIADVWGVKQWMELFVSFKLNN